MNNRTTTLLKWAQYTLNDSELYIKVASADASFRSYWRVFSRSKSYIVMDAPPQHENCIPFIDISKKLDNCGLNIPRVMAQDLTQGFLLLTDLGTVQYLSILSDQNYLILYQDAIKALHNMQQYTLKTNIPEYNQELLGEEINLFSDWFLHKHIGIDLNHQQRTIMDETKNILIENALAQPQTFVHRDYHSRNLMKTSENNPGILDFQDAVIGPVTYDLVSLLKDCYISWPQLSILQLSNEFRVKFNQLNNMSIEANQWKRWFDLMGVQRHLKAIGIFCRLNYRDKKKGYLKDINRILCYIRTSCVNYPELMPLLKLIQDVLPNMDSICEQ